MKKIMKKESFEAIGFILLFISIKILELKKGFEEKLKKMRRK
jgi:hypothetical protein